MLGYIIKRCVLILPTLLGIVALNFFIMQAVPGGPVERVIAQLRQYTTGSERIGGSGGEVLNTDSRGARGVDPALIAELHKEFGFDKPLLERFWHTLSRLLVFDLGESFYRNARVIDLVLEKIPVSLSLGLWTTLLVYLISIPLGIRKAVADGSPFDAWSSMIILIAYAVPSFIFAILLISLFAAGGIAPLFPLRGLVSSDHATLPWYEAILDYAWHLALPILAMVLNGFATLTLLTKNAFLEEIRKNYVLTARAKGLSETGVLYGHVFRNAMLLIIAGLPAAVLGIFFTGSVLIEVIFSLDGLGLLGFEAAINRDYPVMLGTLYIFTLLGLVIGIISDLLYAVIDPRINFNRQDN